MTIVSPLLQSRLNNNANYSLTQKDHEAIYKDLQKHANDVKPNVAKAKLIKEGPLKAVTSAIKDTYQDTKNFKKAVKTGQLGDNSLGRLNDLGMKIGGLLIAVYLATQQRTKTASIMQFVGGGAFFAAMALWPKIAINIPAKMVHGFDIGQRYVSAQGDKKDFFLDNQFLPWDAIPKSEMRKNAQRAGIDFDSENGEEKIRRKMQKTALQSRTLWMATAGFSTPLLTSLFGNIITPKVKDGVIKHGYEHTRSVIKDVGVENYLSYAPAQVLNNDAIEALFNQYKGKELDKKFFDTLTDMLQIYAPEYKTRRTRDGIKLVVDKQGEYVKRGKQLFKDMDDSVPISAVMGLRTDTAKLLKKMAMDSTGLDLAKVRQNLKGAKVQFRPIKDSQIISIMEAIGESTDEETIRRILRENRVAPNSVDKVINSSRAIVDYTSLMEAAKRYNSDVIGEIRGRTKAYLGLLNPIIGQKEESVYTKEYLDTFDNLYNVLDLPYSKGETPSLKNIHASAEKIKQAYVNLFSSNASVDDPEKYKEFLQSLLAQNRAQTKQKMSHLTKLINKTQTKEKKNVFDELILKLALPLQKGLMKRANAAGAFADKDALLAELLKDENIEQIVPMSMRDEITDTIVGNIEKDDRAIPNLIRRFCEIQKTNLSSVEAAPLICANFERRLSAGEFSSFSKEEIEAARNLVYAGNISYRKNNAFFRNKSVYDNIVDKVFDKNAFDVEEGVLPGIKNIVGDLKSVGEDSFEYNSAVEYAQAADLVSQAKTYLTSIFNKKHWEHIFIPMAVALVVITIASQFFFGKIDNEYPEKKEGINNGAHK